MIDYLFSKEEEEIREATRLRIDYYKENRIHNLTLLTGIVCPIQTKWKSMMIIFLTRKNEENRLK